MNRCFLDLFAGEDILHALLAPTSTWYHGIHGWWIFPGDQVEGVAIQALKLPRRPLKRPRQPAVVNARFGPFAQIRSCWRPMLRVLGCCVVGDVLEDWHLFFCWHSWVDWNSYVYVRVKLNLVWGINSYEVFVEEFCLGPEVPMQCEQCEHHGGGRTRFSESSRFFRVSMRCIQNGFVESWEYNCDGLLVDRLIFHDTKQHLPPATFDLWQVVKLAEPRWGEEHVGWPFQWKDKRYLKSRVVLQLVGLCLDLVFCDDVNFEYRIEATSNSRLFWFYQKAVQWTLQPGWNSHKFLAWRWESRRVKHPLTLW